MIYTLTFNPALDYIITPESNSLGNVTRTVSEKLLPGGKGINVSQVLKNLSISSTALGFVGGFTGQELVKMLEDLGIVTDFIYLKSGMTRINVKINALTEQEINAKGPEITKSDIDLLFDKLRKLKCGDILVLSGSVPENINKNIYFDIAEFAAKNGAQTVIDAQGELLVNALSAKPFLIKPNHYELGDIFGKTVTNNEEIIACAKKLQSMGAKNVLVTMASEGAILITESGDTLLSCAPKGNLVNSTGAGDSAIAGFLAAYSETERFKDALAWAVCVGSASAFSDSLAKMEDVQKLLKTLS